MLKIHSKGLGVICIDKNGIKANTKIGDYLGEIYSLWYWYEK